MLLKATAPKDGRGDIESTLAYEGIRATVRNEGHGDVLLRVLDGTKEEVAAALKNLNVTNVQEIDGK